MRIFQDIFETRKRSFISAFSICMTVPLSKDHDQETSKNFWHYRKKFIEIPSRILPEFDKQKCYNYFRKSLAAVNPTKLFAIPDWIPKFNDPSVEFDLSPPTYALRCLINGGSK